MGPRAQAGGTFGNRNFLAGWLVIALPIVVRAALRGRRLATVLVGVVTCLVLLTRCRSAYLAIATSAIVAAALVRRVPRRLDTVGAVAVGVLASCVPWPGLAFRVSVAGAAARLFEHEDGSGLGRVVQHRVALVRADVEP